MPMQSVVGHPRTSDKIAGIYRRTSASMKSGSFGVAFVPRDKSKPVRKVCLYGLRSDPVLQARKLYDSELAAFESDSEEGYLEDAYYEFASMVMRRHSTNPWAPRIHSIKVYEMRDNDPMLYVVKMERLRPVQSDENKVGRKWRDAMRKIREAIDYDDMDLLGDMPNRSQLEVLLSDITDLCESSRARWDLHKGNFMLRGQQLVLTDPIFSPPSDW